MGQEVSGVTRRTAGLVVLAAAVAAAGCDKAQLLAPTKSTITITAGAKVLPPGGSTQISAVVVEEAGSPVQNGTTVRFTTTLGRVDPLEVQTRNGIVFTTFFAGNDSGLATITAISGAASGGSSNGNKVDITIGTAAIKTVTLRASPGSVGPQGGTVELIATVVGESGQPLSGIMVSFNTDQGTLGTTLAATDANGQARTTFTTTQKASVTATAGTQTSTPATVVDLRTGPIVTIACAPASGTGNCAGVQASATSNTATVVFTITRPSTSSPLRSAVLDFGDGTSQALGNLAGTPGGAGLSTTVIRVYDGPSGSTPRAYTATVTAVDGNGESAAASTTIAILPRALLSVTLTATTQTAVVGVGQKVDFEATVTPATGGADVVQEYEWDFGDGSTAKTSGNKTSHVYTSNGRRTATVKVTTTDGRTATGRTEFIISGV